MRWFHKASREAAGQDHTAGVFSARPSAGTDAPRHTRSLAGRVITAELLHAEP